MPAQLHLFGPPTLALADGRREPLPATAPTWLLAVLGLAGDWVPREQLSLMFWPDAGPADAQRQLRVTLHRSRQLLATAGCADALQTERHRARLTLATDVQSFRDAVREARWRDAVDLHTATLLGGQSPRGFSAVDEALHAQRERLQADARRALRAEADALESAGRAEAAIARLRQLLDEDALSEDAVQALLRLAAHSGDRTDALLRFERLRERAAAELGLAPLPATQALADRLRKPAPLTAPILPAANGMPTPAFEPTRPPRSGLAGKAMRPLPATLRDPPLIGREADLRQLAQAAAPLVVIEGEPGVGKTRLLQQHLWARPSAPTPAPASERAHAKNATASGAPEPNDGRTAGPGAAAAVGDVLWVSGRDVLQPAPLQALAVALAPHADGALRASGLSLRDRAVLARLLPAVFDGRAPPAEDDAPSLPAVLAALLNRWPGAVVLDDLQWLDAESLDVVGLALEQPARQAPCWYATLRPAEPGDGLRQWLAAREADARLVRLPLAPLPVAALDDLTSRVLGHPLPAFVEWLGRRSGGNPFLALECLRALHDEGRLDARDATARRALEALGQGVEAAVPPRVAQLLQQRLLRLEDATLRVLRAVAVMGDAEAPDAVDALAALTGLSAWGAAEALGQAQAAGLLRGHAFGHDLVRQVLLDGTPEPLRRVLHAGVAAQLGTHLPPHVRADHWWAAGQPAAALEAVLEAARLDGERGLVAAAERLLTATAERLGPAPPAEWDSARLAVAHAFLARQRLDLDDAEAWCQRALDALPQPATRQAALVERFEVALWRGQLTEAAQWLAAAREIDPDRPSLWLDAAKLAHARGDAAEAAELTGRYVAALRRQAPGVDLAGALTSQGAALDNLGRHAEAAPLHEEALAMARRLGARYTLMEAAGNLVFCLGEQGRDAEAVRVGLQALAEGGELINAPLAANVAYSLLALDRLDEAEHWYGRVLAGENASASCAAAGKLLEIAARRDAAATEHEAGRARSGAGHPAEVSPARRAATEAVFAAIARTEVWSVQASALVAVLTHGPADAVARAHAALRDEPLYPGLQQRLDAALDLARQRLSPA